ncbi:phosphonate C-P lyase system protein PhnH [Bacillus canaveralius]|uniref:phosphonate C-P lyase system protein PhnH n=1 Tax=Bacillus canaveralius TaxID=1403243 RepID=UPI000F788961|nr:phosphonate C-P lyase system protein PhnH [Bacillus canaveralius]RSK55184.1 phosphonate C-P lyase system protein PhnH [Bacillus canaveralius]
MTKVDERFDMIHGTQMIYRKLLDCMARPGKINNILEAISNIEDACLFSPSLRGLAYTLVDREVRFYIEADRKQEVEQDIQWKTFSTTADYVQADYLFFDHAPESAAIHELVEQVKRGTLEDPHLSATLLLNVKSISDLPGEGRSLVLQGPGIKETTTVFVEGLALDWIEARRKVNGEFPLGVDMVLTTRTGDVIAIPRTTVIESEGI